MCLLQEHEVVGCSECPAAGAWSGGMALDWRLYVGHWVGAEMFLL